MQIIKTALISVVLAGFSTAATPAMAAGGYKCAIRTLKGNMNVTFKEGRARLRGRSADTNVNDDGSVQILILGEKLVLMAEGEIKSISGGKTGSHACDLAKVAAELE